MIRTVTRYDGLGRPYTRFVCQYGHDHLSHASAVICKGKAPRVRK